MKKIAVVGTGIAGMGAAYFLRDHCDITFYEKNDYPGGHTHTRTINEAERPVYIDTGFIVFNKITYPNFTRLLQELDVATIPTSMSFSVQHVPSGLEYCGAGINKLFAQRRNLLRPRYWRLLQQMARFCREAPEVLEDAHYRHMTLAEYVRIKGYGEDLLNLFLVPMSSAVWSAHPDRMLNFPALTLVRFFQNHGFLGLNTHYQWYTVKEGSHRYRDKIMALFGDRVWLQRGATEVLREHGRVAVYDTTGARNVYDKVILACHADEALTILGDATGTEKTLLRHFRYERNRVVLHTDAGVMPRNKRAWANWNYRLTYNACGELVPTTVYYMNGLQKVSRRKQYFLSVNDPGDVRRDRILWETVYHHPVYTVASAEAQEQLPELNFNGNVYFCGSYFKYGFHEDALTSGLEVARAIRGERIWT